jgi:pimeloyl-ACP methyl ester carboxylesterase
VLQVPSRAGDERFRRWIAKAQRTVGSPRVVQAYMRARFEVDARPILPLLHAPTLVRHRRNLQLTPSSTDAIWPSTSPGASLIELPGVEGPLSGRCRSSPWTMSRSS